MILFHLTVFFLDSKIKFIFIITSTFSTSTFTFSTSISTFSTSIPTFSTTNGGKRRTVKRKILVKNQKTIKQKVTTNQKETRMSSQFTKLKTNRLYSQLFFFKFMIISIHRKIQT